MAVSSAAAIPSWSMQNAWTHGVSGPDEGFARGLWAVRDPQASSSRAPGQSARLWATRFGSSTLVTCARVSNPPLAKATSASGLHGPLQLACLATGGIKQLVSSAAAAATMSPICAGSADTRGSSSVRSNVQQQALQHGSWHLLPLAAVGLPAAGAHASKQQSGEQEGKGASGSGKAGGACCQGNGGMKINLTGTWIKDRELSESMKPAMDLMHLNGLVRQAVKLVRGVRISQDDSAFTFSVFSFISWFKVTEVYPWSGEPKQFRRRDLRRGKAIGWVEPSAEELKVQLRWNEPFGGVGSDTFRLINENELQIQSVIQVGDQTARYLTVYHRKGAKQHGEHDLVSEDGHHHEEPHHGKGAGGRK